MPLPGNVGTGTITGTFTNDDGSAATGRVYFIPPVLYLLDASADVVVVLREHVVTLDAAGSFSQVLVATDDVDLNPVDWTWTVRVELLDPKRKQVFAIDVPTGTTRNLADIAPALSSSGYASVADGDKGDITVSSSGTVWTVDPGAVLAADVPIADAGGNFTATDVEGALAELANRGDTVTISAAEFVDGIGGTPSRTSVAAFAPAWGLDATANEFISAVKGVEHFSGWATATATFVWAPADATAGNVALSVIVGDLPAGAVPGSDASGSVTPAAPGVANQVVHSATGAFAIPVGPIFIRATRTGSSGSDTYAADAKLIAVIFSKVT